MTRLIFVICMLLSQAGIAQYSSTLKLAVLKYDGGDWYANPTSLKNLSIFCNENLGTGLDKDYATVEPGSPDIFNYPFIHLTGHGNITLDDYEAENMRNYLIAGGFLHMDDNYGLDPYARLVIAKIFPNEELIEVPYDHPIYSIRYEFPDGPPKVHEHDGKPPQGFGIIYEGRLVLYYTYEADLGNGWEDQQVHNDPEEVRLKALKMGANLIKYAFMH